MEHNIFLVRHGLTIWNHESRYQGHTDIELSFEGIRQAESLQKRLANEKIDVFFSSDLKRAMQTAHLLAIPHKLQVQPYQELREINFGSWEGLTKIDIERNYPDHLKIWYNTPHLLQIPNAETFSELQKRVLQKTTELLTKHPAHNIVMVMHGGTIAALICGLLKQPLMKMWDYKHDNCSLTMISWSNNSFSLKLLNDTSHLN